MTSRASASGDVEACNRELDTRLHREIRQFAQRQTIRLGLMLAGAVACWPLW